MTTRFKKSYYARAVLIFLHVGFANAFVAQLHGHGIEKFQVARLQSASDDTFELYDSGSDNLSTRRKMLKSAMAVTGSLMSVGSLPSVSNAAVGTLPEFEDTNAILQGVTINVADKAQQDNMIAFLVNGFDFQVLRKRIKDSVEETVGLLFEWYFWIFCLFSRTQKSFH